MSEREFRLTTPRFFYFKHKGFEAARSESWRIDRLCAYYSAYANLKKGTKPEGLFRIPGDEAEFNYSDREKAALIAHLERAKGVDVWNGETIKAEA